MLDDNIKIIDSLKDTPVLGILFKNSYNNSYKGISVNGWLEFKSYIDNWRC